MKKQILAKQILASVLALAAVGAQAQTQDAAVSITPSFSSAARTECTSASSGGGWLGKALGAVVGGGVGSQIGGGSGQAAAAAIGATLGAQVGEAMSGQQQATQTCRDIIERKLVGYVLQTSNGRDVFVPLQLIEKFSNAGR